MSLSERFTQLSQSCHEQNWNMVHDIAEEVLLGRDELARANQDGIHCGAFDSTSIVDGKKNEADRATSPQTNQLSTCLGTASPLAWTCRYSAPSSTVRLVLELDPSAVRVCLPQLGTPLHECAGRARPLQEFPLKRNRTSVKSKKHEERQKNRDRNVPRVLSGLREWRRTVRALIHADEKLMKEDNLIAAQESGREDDNQVDKMSEVWRKNVQTMIKDNVVNIQMCKDAGGKSSVSGTVDSNHDDEKPSSKASISTINRNPIRAGLAQDADGNTPLHFMIRCAASPAFGGGRWQARQDIEHYSDEGDSSSEEADLRAERGQRDLRYNRLDCGKWDGVRWCMEAHLRRSERRLLRQRRLEEQLAIEDGIALTTKKVRPEDEGDNLSPVSKRVAAVEIASGHCLDFESTSDGCTLPAKRKGVYDTVANTRKRILTSESKNRTRAPRRKDYSTSGKYLDNDERQDCCFDPLLGAVRDLVHSCPDSVGTPDHREYEETPLIVALKSNIYVLMEPEQQFPFLHPGSDGMLHQPGNAPANRSVGDGFALIGGGVLNAGVGVGGGFPIPFPQNDQSGRDRILMSVLRGHGREVAKDTRQIRSTCVPSPEKASSTLTNDAPTVLSRDTKDVPLFEGEDEESSVSGDSSLGVDDDDPHLDAFVPLAHERCMSENNDERDLLSRNRSHYDYQTAMEYRIFCLVRIMLNAHPRAACLMISDYTPLHSAVFHGRSYDTIRILLEAEAQFRSDTLHPQGSVQATGAIPTLPGPAMLCTNTRGELPLHFGCMRNETARTIRLLAETDPRAALVRDASGRTPLRWLWIRFVDGLLDRFGGRDTQPSTDRPSFYEHEGSVAGNSFPNHFPQDFPTVFSNLGPTDMFVFDIEYIRRARTIDRTVDFLRMRHVPSSFEAVEHVAADHAITVLLKLKYLQQRRTRQLDNAGTPPEDVNMSTKEEFILYAFEKFVSLIFAAFVASEVEEQTPDDEKEVICSNELQEEQGRSAPPSRLKLWHLLPLTDCDKRFCLVHEACGSSRASCPAAVAKICMRIFPDQLYHLDDDGRLPLHRVALRGLGWEPPSVDVDSRQALAANETLNLLREVLSRSRDDAARTYDKNNQLPLHCAVDSMVTSILMGSSRRASLHAEARITLQTHRHKIVETAITCLSDLLRANSLALRCKDGRTGLLPFMQAASFDHQPTSRSDVVKYVSDLSKRPGFDVGAAYNSLDNDVVEEDGEEADAGHISIIYYLIREDPSAIHCI